MIKINVWSYNFSSSTRSQWAWAENADFGQHTF